MDKQIGANDVNEVGSKSASIMPTTTTKNTEQVFLDFYASPHAKSEEYIEGFSLTLEEFISLREKSELILWVASPFPYEGVIADIPPRVFEDKTFYPYLSGTKLPVSL